MPTSRRKFLETLAGSSVLASLNGGVAAALTGSVSSSRCSRAFAYLASGAGDSSADHSSGLHVFEVRGRRWTLKQRVESSPIAAISLHPSGQFLYTVGDRNESDGLPRGAVEGYRIDPHDGSPTLINRQYLALSAIGPRHLAIAPGGDTLAVAVHRGGAYNLLPIRRSGVLGPVSARWKETGCGPHPVHQASAHPHTVLFDRSGRYFLAIDQGCDRISLFTLHDGGIARRHQISSPGGPGHAVLHPSGSLLFVSSTLEDRIDGYRTGWPDGMKLEHLSTTQAAGIEASDFGDETSLAIHPHQNILYSSDSSANGGGISTWAIDTPSGELSRLHRQPWNGGLLRGLVPCVEAQTLYAIDRNRECVLGFAMDPKFGTLGKPIVMARVPNPVSLTLKQL